MATSSKFDIDVPFTKIDGLCVHSKVITADGLEEVKGFEFESGDLLSVTYPKAGQVWFLTILHLIGNASKIENNEDIPTVGLHDSIFIEFRYPDGEYGAKKIKKQLSPRLIKSHLPLRYFKAQLEQNPNVKVAQVIRNPKDLLVSYYHHYRMSKGVGCFNGSWDDFFEMVKSNDIVYGDLFEHTAHWYEFNRNRPNSLVLVYEDMKKNLKENILLITKFLNKELSDKTIDEIVKLTTFKNMQQNEKFNLSTLPNFKPEKSPFMRKGEVGDWFQYFSDEQNAFVEDKCQIFDPLGLNFLLTHHESASLSSFKGCNAMN